MGGVVRVEDCCQLCISLDTVSLGRRSPFEIQPSSFVTIIWESAGAVCQRCGSVGTLSLKLTIMAVKCCLSYWRTSMQLLQLHIWHMDSHSHTTVSSPLTSKRPSAIPALIFRVLEEVNNNGQINLPASVASSQKAHSTISSTRIIWRRRRHVFLFGSESVGVLWRDVRSRTASA